MANASALLGTWRMLSWKKEFVATGNAVDALGPDPEGFITYTADGRRKLAEGPRRVVEPDANGHGEGGSGRNHGATLAAVLGGSPTSFEHIEQVSDVGR